MQPITVCGEPDDRGHHIAIDGIITIATIAVLDSHTDIHHQRGERLVRSLSALHAVTLIAGQLRPILRKEI
jgi:hypothetical protein